MRELPKGAEGSGPPRATGPSSSGFNEGRAHAALVFDGDEAVAWCQYGTPAELPNIKHRTQY
jgi:hypothetical protein